MNNYIAGYLSGYMTKAAATPKPPASVTGRKLPKDSTLPTVAEEMALQNRTRDFNKYLFESAAKEALPSMALSALGGTTGIFHPRSQYNVYRDDPDNAPLPEIQRDDSMPAYEDDGMPAYEPPAHEPDQSRIGKPKGMGKQATDKKTQARMSSDDYPSILKAYHEWIARRLREKRQQGLSGKVLGEEADRLRKQLQTWKRRFSPIPKSTTLAEN